MLIEMYDDEPSYEELMSRIQRERAFVHAAVYILSKNPDFASNKQQLEYLLEKIQQTYRHRTRELMEKNEALRNQPQSTDRSMDGKGYSESPGFHAIDSQLAALSLLRDKK